MRCRSLNFHSARSGPTENLQVLETASGCLWNYSILNGREDRDAGNVFSLPLVLFSIGFFEFYLIKILVFYSIQCLNEVN